MSKRDDLINEMKERVFAANMRLPEVGLVKLTWGNASEINRQLKVIVIKPSGVPYATMRAEQMVVTDLEGQLLGTDSLKPSSDLATHVVLYRAFTGIQGIVHTHSQHAVMWAQAGLDIPAYGTTHADTFYGPVPCTRVLTEKEINQAYEAETGHVIIETFKTRDLDPLAVPGVIVNGHGPFSWGESLAKAVDNSIILDEVAKMALGTELINPKVSDVSPALLAKHYFRKHGKNAYYGQG